MARQDPAKGFHSYQNIVSSYSQRFKYSAYQEEDECSTESFTDEELNDNSFEPPWAGSVGQKGDVFYVEPGDPGSEDSQSRSHDNHTSNPVQNGLNNSQHHQQMAASASLPTTTGKTKQGIKKKVKGIISSRNRTNNNDSELNNGKHAPVSVHRNNYRNHVTPSTPHTVTFNDMPTGLIKDVALFVDPYRHNYGRRATLCETLFGIIPGSFSSKANLTNGSTQDRRIMVQGLLPGGEALRSGQIKIGDWLMCINDLDVNLDNFDSILSAITTPKEVKLSLQKLAVQPVSSPRSGIVHKSPVNEALVKLISGERLSLDTPSLADAPHAVMFLTLGAGSDAAGPKAKDDVLYQFPPDDSKLVEIRGLFLTLGNMFTDITSNTPRYSTLLVDSKLLHVGYAQEGEDLLIVAMPVEKLPVIQLRAIVDDVVRLLRVLYGSLHSAFTSTENHGRLNHFFTLLCQKTLLGEELLKQGLQTFQQEEPFLNVLPGVRSLVLPEETKVLVNNCLSELEAADFADMSEDYYDLRRSYVFLGTCLHYKGYLVASHLHQEDLLDINLYLHYYCLLTLCHGEQMGQVVVWKEVFPWRRCHVQSDPLLPGYTEPEARWFLLVVGMKNTMLAVLLEAGGCAAWAEGHPTPDPFYVDQAKASLLQLEALDVPNQCELRLLSPSVPSLASVDWFFPSTKGLKEDPTTQPTSLVKIHNSPKSGPSPSKKLMQPESILKKKGATPSPQSDRLRLPGRGGAVYDVESDADSHSTGNSESSTPIMDRRGRKPSAGSDESIGSCGSSSLFKGQKKKRTLLSAYDVSGLKTSLREIGMEEGSFVKLTSGCDNTLFNYVQLDISEGIYICPTQQEISMVTSPRHIQVLRNFHKACLSIRELFQQNMLAAQMSSTTSQFAAPPALGTVQEHGILFHCVPENWTDQKKPPPVVSYWVVGRQLPGPYQRELYVCFQDSAQQNLVELAFKLGFGVLV